MKTRVIKNSKKLIPVSVGDRIRAEFPHYFSDPEGRHRIGEVLKVTRRYGHHGDFVRTAPLLYVKIHGKKEPQYFDQSFVVEVLSHRTGPTRPAENVFRGAGRSRIGYWRPLKKGVWQGNLIGLVCHVLENHHARITHPLDDDKLDALFARDLPGYMKHEYGTIVVRAEIFKRWVRQNYQKFLATTAEMDADATETNLDNENWMAADEAFLEESESQKLGSDYDYGYYPDFID